jgi:hypothetical protein
MRHCAASSRRSSSRRLAWVAVVACSAATAIAQQPAGTSAPPPPKPAQDGGAKSDSTTLLAVDQTDWKLSVHKVEGLRTWAELRGRAEAWSYLHNPSTDGRYGYQQLRFRAGVEQTIGNVRIGGEGQTVNLWGVPAHASGGPGKNYYDADHSRSPESVSVRQLYADVLFDSDTLRVGRQIESDGAGVKYDDAAFQYVRDRGNERLVGPADWVAGGRSFDGLSLTHEQPNLFLKAYAFEANAGAFEVEQEGASLRTSDVAGLDVIWKRGTLVPDTELRAFGVVFHDDRNATVAKLGDEVLIETIGAQAASRVELGPGSADLFLWGARQSGDAGTKTQRSGAWIAEAGYRLDHAPLAPWLRVGHARGEGDRDKNDHQNNDFYNGLPTNHMYYGYADLFALTNLRDSYVDLILDPRDDLRFMATYHYFASSNGASPTTFGSGAYNDKSFGYGTFATTSSHLGEELDLTLRWTSKSRKSWALLGYSRFFGATAFERLFAEDDVSFGYLELGTRF